MTDDDIRFYLSMLWRRMPYLALVAVSISAIGIAVAYVLPPVYRATAKILVEAPQIPANLARSTVPADPWQQMQIVQEKLTTRENLLDFARRLNIYGTGSDIPSDNEIVDDMRDRTIFEKLYVDAPMGDQGASMFTISFDAREPQLAARVTNAFVTLMLDSNVNLRTDRASDTMQFFTREVKRLGDELGGIESRILAFKNQNESALPDSMDFKRAQRSHQEERLLLLEREESSLRTRRNAIMRSFEATGRIASAGPLSPEQQTLEDLNRTLSNQLVIFSEDSPNIATLRARIAALTASIKSRQAADPTTPGPSEMDLQLADMNDRLRTIADERKSISGDLAELEKSIAAIPANETSLDALERNRQNIQAQYNIAIAKLAEASTGEQIEASAKGGRMSVIEPAAPPAAPIKPRRMRIAALSVGAGLAGALGLMVLLEVLNTRVRRPKELVDLLHVQPLATIPYIWTPTEVRDRRVRIAATSIAAVTAMPVLAFLAGHFTPVTSLIGKVASVLGYGNMM